MYEKSLLNSDVVSKLITNAERLHNEHTLELLIKLYDNMEYFRFGFCYTINELEENFIISEFKGTFLQYRLKDILPKPKYKSNTSKTLMFSFRMGDIDSRIYWLKSQIEKLKACTK